MDNNFQIKELIKKKIIFEKYQIIKKIEKNKNLQVYEGKNILLDELLIIKIEQKKEKKKRGMLEIESYYLNYLKSPGIQTITKIGYYGNSIISIQPKLGLTLSQIFIKNYGIIKIKDIALISIQILERIKYIHSKNIIHCNINPKSFSLGVGRFQNIIYITDFISAKRFKDKNTLEHIKFNISNKFNGNYIFGSINSLRGVELSRRDDLESLAYMLIYFLKGNLPWVHIKCLNKTEKIRKIYQIKKNCNLSILCDGLPEEFKLFLNYVKSLKFLEEPDYNYCFSLFYGIFKKMKIINDGIFSWYQEKNKENPKIINNFYNKLWFDKYFNNNTSTISIFNEYLEENNLFKKSNDNIKKSHSCFLNIHNSAYYILNNYDNNFTKTINYSNKKEIIKKYDYSLSDNNSEINDQNSIEEDLNKQNNYLKNSEEKDDNISSSSKKEYSIEGKIEQEGEKIKTYEKKKIGKSIKKSFNEIKNNEKKKLDIIQNELMKIKKRIYNKKQKDEKSSFNYVNKRYYLNEANKTFSKQNYFFQTDIINSDYLKKSIPFIKPGNSSTKNDYLKNRIKYFSRKSKKNKEMNFSGFSQINNQTKKSRIKNLTNINFSYLTNDNNKEFQNINEDNIKKRQKTIISLNLENIILNTQRLKNILNKSIINNNNEENSLKKIKKFTNQNSINNISKKNTENNKPEIIKVIKKNISKAIKPDIKNKIKKINVYEHKSLVCNYLNTHIYKKKFRNFN